MRILIAEDDPTSRKILTRCLEKLGYQVVATTNGLEAWQAMQQADAPKLAILDWMMPEIDGVEVCRRLRAINARQQPYLILLSALGTKEDIAKGLDAGADDYLTKPFNVLELQARIKVGVRLLEMQARLRQSLETIEASLLAAGEIQKSLLPKHFIGVGSLEFAWQFVPCDAIGGDVFNIVPLDAQRVGLYMVDVAGHGPAAAMVSVLVYQLLNATTGILADHTVKPPRILEPEEVLRILDGEFPLMRFKRHFTIVYAVFNHATGVLTYSNAGHCSPMVVDPNADVTALTTAGTVIGVGAMPFGQESVALSPGYKIVFCSDGVEEIADASNAFFGEERTKGTLLALQKEPVAALVQGLYDAALGFAGGHPPGDDLSILAFEYKGVLPASS